MPDDDADEQSSTFYDVAQTHCRRVANEKVFRPSSIKVASCAPGCPVACFSIKVTKVRDAPPNGTRTRRAPLMALKTARTHSSFSSFRARIERMQRAQHHSTGTLEHNYWLTFKPGTGHWARQTALAAVSSAHGAQLNGTWPPRDAVLERLRL